MCENFVIDGAKRCLRAELPKTVDYLIESLRLHETRERIEFVL